MPPKKKGSVKKKKKKGLVDVPPVPRSLYGVGSGNENVEKILLEKLTTRNDLVFVRLKQSDWSFSDFTVMVHASAPLYTICRKIEEKHGRMASDAQGNTSLQLFRHPPNEKNLLPPSDWHLRLDQVGMTGGTVEEQHSAIIYYNFVPATYSPLLQREPQLMITKLSAEETEALAEQRQNEVDFLSSMEMSAPSPSLVQSTPGSPAPITARSLISSSSSMAAAAGGTQ